MDHVRHQTKEKDEEAQPESCEEEANRTDRRPGDYYYDDATNYEVYRDDDGDEANHS